MKRDPALVSLSHDHHRALFVAQQLEQAIPAAELAALADALERADGADR